MKSLTQIEGKSGVLSYGLYQMFRERFESMDCNSELNVYYPTWLRICKKFNERKMQSIISGHIFNMPFRLGSIGIVQFKRRIKFDENGNLITKGFAINWDKTIKMWRQQYGDMPLKEYGKIRGKKVVFITNEHTDGRMFRFHWKKKYAVVKNISAYELKIPQHYKDDLCKLILAKPNVQYCTKF